MMLPVAILLPIYLVEGRGRMWFWQKSIQGKGTYQPYVTSWYLLRTLLIKFVKFSSGRYQLTALSISFVAFHRVYGTNRPTLIAAGFSAGYLPFAAAVPIF